MRTPPTALPVAATFSATDALARATIAKLLSCASLPQRTIMCCGRDAFFLNFKLMEIEQLNKHDIYAIQVGEYFGAHSECVQLVYSPLANVFFLATPDQVEKITEEITNGVESSLSAKILDRSAFPENAPVNEDTFCTLHLLLNEKCNFSCRYCYSAKGRSSAELSIDDIQSVLNYFLSSERQAVKDRTVMFMGGGEPMLSWNLLKEATLMAERIASKNGISLHLSLTTNGSIMPEEALDFLKEHNFTIQISFEVLPKIQKLQRGNYETVAKNINRISQRGINNYVRSTITVDNVDLIEDMVRHLHKEFPNVKKFSVQQVVDPEYFTSKDVVDDFFNRYFINFRKAVAIAEEFGIALRSSSSHLLNYSKRERFCFNLLCLTPYGSLTLCPDVSSPNEKDYEESVIGKIEDGEINIDKVAYDRQASGSIHSIEKCKRCFAKWNCGSGCPSSRRVYSPEIFDSICDYYRRMTVTSLMDRLIDRHRQATGRDLIEDITTKLQSDGIQ